MSAQPCVSVVIPVYNTEQYLEECIESLIHQTLTNIEMIFVDDGSTDRSLEILKNYEKADSRVHVLTQHNQYAGVARNNGMDHATGKYIIFLDSDDFFDINMLDEMYRVAEGDNTDITICGYCKYDDITKAKHDIRVYKKGEVFHPEDLGSDIFNIISPEPWNKLYLRRFVVDNGFRFQNIKNTNDTYFTRVTAVLSKRIRIIDKSYVFYRINNSSSLQGSFITTHYCFGEAIIAIKDELIKRNAFSDEIADAFYNEAASIMLYYQSKVQTSNNEELFFKYCQKIIQSIDIPDKNKKYYTNNLMLAAILNGDSYAFYLYQKGIQFEGMYQEVANRCRTLSKQIDRLKKSTTYRTGEIVLFIPMKIKGLWEKIKIKQKGRRTECQK